MYFLVADQLLIFDRVAQTITVLVNAFWTRRKIPPKPTKMRRAKSNGSCRCSNSRANTSRQRAE
jgi:hypothetical protein